MANNLSKACEGIGAVFERSMVFLKKKNENETEANKKVFSNLRIQVLKGI